jgi:signal transduction histidine kinase
MVRRIGGDLETALEELRTLAQGKSPTLLTRHGLEPALKEAALRTTLPTSLQTRRITRYDPEIEAAVYFCCLEALQNAAKHAGPDASITVIVSDQHGSLTFEIADTGAGFDHQLETSGSGLTHLRDRIGALGGRATITSTPGHGTSVAGMIPIPVP